MSPSTRRAWIEIALVNRIGKVLIVALHPEGVDRNSDILCSLMVSANVALHPEGVDRNFRQHAAYKTLWALSPSTRRAWIEIFGRKPRIEEFGVALHPEGVDRNSPSLMVRS